MRFADKRDLVGALLDFMKVYNISDNHKEIIYNMVLSLSKKTENQKERFIRYYGLKPPEFKSETMTSIARDSNCTPSAVRTSIITIRIALVRHISEDEFHVLEQIYKEYQK